MTQIPNPDVAKLMAGIVENRTRTWSLVNEVVSRPDQQMVERLNSGDWVADMQDAVQWLGDAAERFVPGLEAVTHVAETTGTTLADVTAGFDAISARERASLTAVISDLLGQLAAEERAWSQGDDEYAKTLRLAQHDQLHKRMVPALQQWCYDALNQQAAPVLAALVKVVVIVLSMETGRDFERAMEGRGFRITDDLR
ncbi:MAG: hypothetical protein Q4P15_08185 [Propionibacteriaceae bacterium]|nr:hypothetical protein [Propionibacteriaceae bacterium]